MSVQNNVTDATIFFLYDCVCFRYECQRRTPWLWGVSDWALVAIRSRGQWGPGGSCGQHIYSSSSPSSHLQRWVRHACACVNWVCIYMSHTHRHTHTLDLIFVGETELKYLTKVSLKLSFFIYLNDQTFVVKLIDINDASKQWRLNGERVRVAYAKNIFQ